MGGSALARFVEACAPASVWLSGASSWARGGIAVGCGAFAALAHAPYYIFIAMPVGFTVLALLVDGAVRRERPLRSAAFVGWAFGFGYFLAGVYWVSLSMLVDAASFAWMIPFAVTLLPSGLALFTAAACVGAAAAWRPGLARVLTLSLCIAVAEFARGHILTGFPWNLPGQMWTGYLPMAQIAAWIGPNGLTFLTVLAAAAPATIVNGQGGPAHRPWAGLAAALVLLSAMAAVGHWRMAGASAAPRDDLQVRVVQPSISQRDKADPDKRFENFQKLLQVTATPSGGPAADIVLWPENAAPFIRRDAAALDYAGSAADGLLVAGGTRFERRADGSAAYFNSLAVITADGGLVGSYDKHKLAPFGEYLPFSDWASAVGISALIGLEGGFTRGAGPAVIALDGVPPFAPLICYESIFPQALYPRGARPDWLLIITNDGWFGDSAGPRQHLAQAQLRAIETGLPIARAANTGVSAVIDPVGRIVERLALYEVGVIDTALSAPLPATLYSTHGEIIFIVLVLIVSGSLRLHGALMRVEEDIRAHA